MAAPMPVMQERLIANRDLRLAVGEDAHVVEVKVGDDLPEGVCGRLDVLLRVGYVIRIDENGKVDPRSWRFARRLGIPREPPAPVRGFLERARALEQIARTPNGKRIRVFPGKPDGSERELFVVAGRAYPALRGAPDSFAAREALRAPLGGHSKGPRAREGAGQRRRRRKAKG